MTINRLILNFLNKNKHFLQISITHAEQKSDDSLKTISLPQGKTEKNKSGGKFTVAQRNKN